MTGRNPAALLGLSTPISPPVELTGARFGVRIFTASGEFTLPSGVTSVIAMVLCVGGGGGGGGYGAGSPYTGSTGGTTSFGALASAGGGSGGSGGNNGSIGLGGATGYQQGADGTPSNSSGPSPGGLGFMGFGPGGHGGPSTGLPTYGSGSGASGLVAVYFGAVTASQTVTIGAGGTVNGNSNGKPGGAGACVVFYWW